MPHPYLEGTPEQKAAAQRAEDIRASQGANQVGKPDRPSTQAKK